MSKKVITKQDVQRWYFEGVKEISLDNSTIILPGAKDALMTAGIKVKAQEAQDLLRQKIRDCCNEKGIDETLKEKVVDAIIKKYITGKGE